MTKVECFFDCSSPWAYLGFSNLVTLATRLGIAVEWRPVVSGFIFAEVNQDIYASRRLLAQPLKGAHERREMQQWAAAAGLIIRAPPKCGHPVKSIKCMRGCVALMHYDHDPAAPADKLIAFATAAYEALWRDGRNLGHDDVLADICRQIGVSPEWFFAAIDRADVRDTLKRNGDALVALGGFGVPTYYVNDELLLFGNNRLPLVEHHLRASLRIAAAGTDAAQHSIGR
jgi:2-hydroxychromene-2-carboxylate isomerase